VLRGGTGRAACPSLPGAVACTVVRRSRLGVCRATQTRSAWRAAAARHARSSSVLAWRVRSAHTLAGRVVRSQAVLGAGLVPSATPDHLLSLATRVRGVALSWDWPPVVCPLSWAGWTVRTGHGARLLVLLSGGGF